MKKTKTKGKYLNLSGEILILAMKFGKLQTELTECLQFAVNNSNRKHPVEIARRWSYLKIFHKILQDTNIEINEMFLNIDVPLEILEELEKRMTYGFLLDVQLNP